MSRTRCVSSRKRFLGGRPASSVSQTVLQAVWFSHLFMDAGVRKALTSLKALLDEGFITKAEFGTRRQVIIDQATAVQPVAAPQTSADSTGITGLARSVFDRLGEAPQKRGGVFDRLGLPKPAGSIRKPGVHGEQTDLRAKLTGGIKKPGAIKKPGERDIRKPGYDTTKPRGPAACPW